MACEDVAVHDVEFDISNDTGILKLPRGTFSGSKIVSLPFIRHSKADFCSKHVVEYFQIIEGLSTKGVVRHSAIVQTIKDTSFKARVDCSGNRLPLCGSPSLMIVF